MWVCEEWIKRRLYIWDLKMFENKWEINRKVCQIFMILKLLNKPIKRAFFYVILIKFSIPKIQINEYILDGTQNKVRIENYFSPSFLINKV